MSTRRRVRGFTLIELLAAVAIIGLIALCSVPAFGTYRRRASCEAAGNELRILLRGVRAHAIAEGRYAGVKFAQVPGNWTYSLYDDGNGNGVANDDIKRGLDVRFRGPVVTMPQSGTVSIRLLPQTVRDPDGAKLQPSSAALQFGRSTICSFSPVGAGTPGTIYLSDGIDQLWCVRVYGASGKVRLLRYDARRAKWEER